VSVQDITPAETERLLDAAVRIRGVGCSRFNQRRQLRAPWLAVSEFADIDIERPAPGAPEAVSLASLSQFDSGMYSGRRVRVCGVVTLQKADGSLFLQSGGAGLCVRSAEPGRFGPGDFVSAAGYSAPGPYMPVLEDAMVRPLGRTNLPPALPVELPALLHSPEDFAGVLVRIEADLMNRIEDPPRRSLVLQSSNVIFTAQIENARTGPWFKSLNAGSRLLLTGVCEAQPPAKWVAHLAPAREKTVPGLPAPPPESIQILLRSPADIVVLRQPPWWTLSRLLGILALLILLLLAAAAWVVGLNRQVRWQTQVIEQKNKREGVLRERDRIAREFHDTLEQEIAAISIQLDAVDAQFNSPQIARQLLALARNMARHSLAEARRSVRDLRSHLLEHNDLPAALREMAAPFAASSGVEIAVQYSGPHQKLSALTEHHLLRVAQEAIANALKHGRAKKVVVALNYADGPLQLSIRDDGVGFDPDVAGSVNGGHFGLLDMRERTEKIGGQFVLCSRPGHGTEVLISLAGPPAPRRSGVFELPSPP
jgi:signal transduction histidine kinase